MANELPTIEIKNVEIFSEGKWNSDNYSSADLQAMIDAFDQVGFEPPVKAGHEEGQEQGQEVRRKLFGAPALGYVKRLYLSGKKLMADLGQVPARFGQLIKAGAYKRISAEIYWSYADESTGKKWPRVLKAISFLGADIPALTNLKAVESLYTRIESGALVYQDGKNEVRVYDKDYCGEMMGGMSLADYLIRYPRKSKDEAGYDLADEGSQETCGNCKFWIPGMTSCTLVEGNIEAHYTSDYFESYGRPTAMLNSKSAVSLNFKNYTIEKRDGKYCLIAKSTGKVLGCHETEDEAMAQEKAIEANKHDFASMTAEQMKAKMAEMKEEMAEMSDGPKKDAIKAKMADMKKKLDAMDDHEEMSDATHAWVTIDEMRKICPSCADNMRALKFTKIKASVEEIESLKEAHSASENKGGHNMPEDKVASFDKEAGDKILAQVDEKIATVRKDYEQKLETKDQAIEAANKRSEELEKRLAATEQEKRVEGIKAFLQQQKVAGKIGDSEIPRAEAILMTLSESKTVKYSQDGKDEEKSEIQAFKEFITKRPSLFRELSTEDETDEIDEVATSKYADASDESDKRAKAYIEKNPTATMKEAYKVVWDKDPKLFRAWQGSRQ